MTTIGAVPISRSGSEAVTASSDVSAEEHAAALVFLQTLATEVSEGTVDLPCFPHVVVRISAALADANTTAEDVVAMVGTEPRLLCLLAITTVVP